MNDLTAPLALGILACALVSGCGGSATTPPAPVYSPSASEAPEPEETATAREDEAPAAAPPEVLDGPPPAVTLRALQLPPDATVQSVRLPITREELRTDGYRVRLDLVQLPDAVATAALARVLRGRAGRFADYRSGEGGTRGACTTTFVHPRLVGWECALTYHDYDRTSHRDRELVMLAIGEHGEVLDVAPRDLFLDYGRVETLARARAEAASRGGERLALTMDLGVGAAGMIVPFAVYRGSHIDRGARSTTLPWSEIATLIDADGGLAPLFPDAPWLDVTPAIDTTGSWCAFVVTAARPYAEILSIARGVQTELPQYVLPFDATRGRLVLLDLRRRGDCSEASQPVAALAADAGSTPLAIPRAGLMHVEKRHTVAPALLHAEPSEDTPVLGAIPRDAYADALHGRVGGRWSGPGGEGSWALVSVAGRAGWVRGETLVPGYRCPTLDYETHTIGRSWYWPQMSSGSPTPVVWRASYDAAEDSTQLTVHRTVRCGAADASIVDLRVRGQLLDVAFPRAEPEGPSVAVVITAPGGAGAEQAHVEVHGLESAGLIWTRDLPAAGGVSLELEAGTADAYRAFVIAGEPPIRVAIHDGAVRID